MEQPIRAREGHLSFRGYQIWYRVVGDTPAVGKLPLLCLHGGPGGAHDYLEPLEELAAGGRQVIFYDQLGCGKSDQPHDPSLWTVDLFLDELATVRRELGLGKVHILGQSWGGMLALEYAVRKPRGLSALVLASAPASARQWAQEAARLRQDLPPDVQATLVRHEAAGTTDSPEYTDAMMVFYRRHVCRMDPWPECLNRSLEGLAKNPEVYLTMWGPSEFHVTGTLKDWDVSHRLGEIAVPTLITSGRFDEATPAIVGILLQGIPWSRQVIFEHSAHQSHLEEAEAYRTVVERFLADAEKSQP